MCRRGAARFPHADADPCQEQLGEILGQAGNGRHAGPHRERRSYDQRPAAGRAVGIARDGDPQHGIEQRKSQPGHQSDLRVAQPQFEPDRFGQDVDDLPVDEIEDVDDQQDPQHCPRRLLHRMVLGTMGLRRCHQALSIL
jgi:hypothetical protein